MGEKMALRVKKYILTLEENEDGHYFTLETETGKLLISQCLQSNLSELSVVLDKRSLECTEMCLESVVDFDNNL